MPDLTRETIFLGDASRQHHGLQRRVGAHRLTAASAGTRPIAAAGTRPIAAPVRTRLIAAAPAPPIAAARTRLIAAPRHEAAGHRACSSPA
jgi:hypothetical protein